MRWMAALSAIVILVVLGVSAWLFLPPPPSGPGWRLGPATWHQPLSPDDVSSVVVYPVGAEEVGIGITVFGSSSCPPKVRDVRIGSTTVEVEVRGDLGFGACTADAAPHPFGILVRRDALPPIPFAVVVRHGSVVDEVEIAELPSR